MNSNQTFFHLEIIHELAESCGGKLIVASFGEDSKTGKKLKPKVGHFNVGDITGMAAFIEKISHDEHRNIYIPMCTMISIPGKPLLPTSKGAKENIEKIFAFVADFDDVAAADYLTRLQCPPNYVLETSKDRYQCFLFPDRALTRTEAQPFADSLQKYSGCDHGTKDLGHVWRVPGCLNWPNKKKLDSGRPAEPQLVSVVKSWDGSRFDFDGLNANNETESVTLSRKDSLKFSKDAEPPADKFRLLCKNYEEFEKLWEKKPKQGDTSPSGYDYALIKLAIQAGWSDQECLNLMLSFRRKHNFDMKLKNNKQYYPRTLVAARKDVQEEGAIDAVEISNLFRGSQHEPVNAKQEGLDALSEVFKVKIKQINRFVQDNPCYFIITNRGEVELRNTDELFSLKKFQVRWAAELKLYFKCQPKKWQGLVQLILDCSDDIDTDPESKAVERIKQWIWQYLTTWGVLTREQSAIEGGGKPFVENGHCYIAMEEFTLWAYRNRSFTGTAQQLSQEMRRVHCESKPFNMKIAEKRTTRNFWQIPEEIADPKKIV
jgi:hypothetical protein